MMIAQVLKAVRSWPPRAAARGTHAGPGPDIAQLDRGGGPTGSGNSGNSVTDHPFLLQTQGDRNDLGPPPPTVPDSFPVGPAVAGIAIAVVKGPTSEVSTAALPAVATSLAAVPDASHARSILPAGARGTESGHAVAVATPGGPSAVSAIGTVARPGAPGRLSSRHRSVDGRHPLPGDGGFPW